MVLFKALFSDGLISISSFEIAFFGKRLRWQLLEHTLKFEQYFLNNEEKGHSKWKLEDDSFSFWSNTFSDRFRSYVDIDKQTGEEYSAKRW